MVYVPSEPITDTDIVIIPQEQIGNTVTDNITANNTVDNKSYIYFKIGVSDSSFSTEYLTMVEPNIGYARGERITGKQTEYPNVTSEEFLNRVKRAQKTLMPSGAISQMKTLQRYLEHRLDLPYPD